MRDRFFADPPRAIGLRGIPGYLSLSIKRLRLQVWQIITPFESEPGEIDPFPESDLGMHVAKSTVDECQWIFDQAEQRRTRLEQKAQSTFSLMVFLVPVLTSAFIFIASNAKSGGFRDVTIALVSVSGVFILLGFVAAIRAVSVKSIQTLSLSSVLDSSGKFRAYDESFHAKGLLYCASVNTAANDHLAQFVRGAHSMTAIAVLFVILAAVPTSFTAATRSSGVAHTAIVGPVEVVPLPGQTGQSLQEKNGKLSARIELLEQRVTALEKKTTEQNSASLRRRSGSGH